MTGWLALYHEITPGFSHLKHLGEYTSLISETTQFHEILSVENKHKGHRHQYEYAIFWND